MISTFKRIWKLSWKYYILCTISLTIVFYNCSSVTYLNDFSMRGLHSSTFLPRPVDSISTPHARISGAIQYSSVNRLGYNDGGHSNVDSNGSFYFEQYLDYPYCGGSHGPCPSYTATRVALACSLSYQGSNIHWRTPPLYTSFSADFGPFAKIVSVSTQTDCAIMDGEFFINLKVGPTVQFTPKNTGIRADFIFSAGNYYYSYQTVNREGSLWYIDNHAYNAGIIYGFCPNITVNTLKEFLHLCYYVQTGYQLQLPFYYDDISSVKFSYALFNFGIFKNISNYQLLAGARFAFETKHNYYDDPHPHLRKRNTAQTPVFPTFFFNWSYNVNFKKK